MPRAWLDDPDQAAAHPHDILIPMLQLLLAITLAAMAPIAYR